MNPLYVHGMGLFTPGYPNLASFIDQARDATADKPAAQLLAGPFKRRASLLTRMAVEAFHQAGAQASADLSTVPSVWGIVRGEIKIAVDLLGMMLQGAGKLSPTKFHNSVYNTASGYASIACKNQAPSTTLTGGREIVAMGLLESAGLLAEGATHVIAVWADEPYPTPFDAPITTLPMALSLCLSSDARGALAELREMRRAPGRPSEAPDAYADLYLSTAIPLMRRIARRDPGRVALELPAADAEDSSWCIEVGFENLTR